MQINFPPVFFQALSFDEPFMFEKIHRAPDNHLCDFQFAGHIGTRQRILGLLTDTYNGDLPEREISAFSDKGSNRIKEGHSGKRRRHDSNYRKRYYWRQDIACVKVLATIVCVKGA